MKGLTIQQRQLLIRSALAFPEGRLVIFVTLYKRADEPDPFAKGQQKRRPKRRMYADWTNTRDGVVPNARFSVFFCRDDTRMKVLICHMGFPMLFAFSERALASFEQRWFGNTKAAAKTDHRGRQSD